MPGEPRKWHFGVLPFTGTGHLLPLIALAQGLKRRGHRVTFFEKTKIEERVCNAGLEFVPVVSRKHSDAIGTPGSGPGLLSELRTLRFNLRRITCEMATYLDATIPAISAAGVDAIIVNEIALTGPTVAQLLGLPYFILSTSLPHHLGWGGFGWLPGYRYSESVLAPVQRALLELSCLRMRGPIRHTLDGYRKQLGLGPVRNLTREYPPLAHITQVPQCMDPRPKSPPATIHFTGPWVSSASRPAVEFPWGRLDGRPLVYASLGTTRNVLPHIFRLIAEACHGLDVQLVISLGNRFPVEEFSGLPGQPLIVDFAPQLELLSLASVVITHGGPNTAIEALMAGRPMIAIPLAYDQPAIASCLARLHVARVLPVMRLSSRRIRAAVVQVLNSPKYREAALKMQAELRSLRGDEHAASVIESSLEQELSGAPTGIALRSTETNFNHSDGSARVAL